MAHAIRLRLSTPNAPEQAQQQWDDWRTDWQEALPDQRTDYRTVPESDLDDRPEHDLAIARFDDAEDRDDLVNALRTQAYPSVEWVVIHTHDCDHDRPDNNDGCEDWQRVYERGNVPEVLR